MPLSLIAGGMANQADTILSNIIRALEHATDYASAVEIKITPPAAAEPIIFHAYLQSTPTPGDTLSPCAYLIESSPEASSSKSFSAYFDRHLYRFSNGKLKAYHYADSPSAFAPGNDPREGLQQQSQFALLLPAMIARRLRELQNDSTYTYNIKGTPEQVAVEAQGTRPGSALYSYTFTTGTFLPRSMTITYNPGAVSEQLIQASYSAPDTEALSAFTETSLLARHPEAFKPYTAHDLIGQPMPSFHLRKLGAQERLSHTSGQGLPQPTLYVFIDSASPAAATVVEQVRTAATDTGTAIVWAFPTTNHMGEILTILTDVHTGETALPGASSLASDCGISQYPAFILVTSDGVVQKVAAGTNNLPEKFVIL